MKVGKGGGENKYGAAHPYCVSMLLNKVGLICSSGLGGDSITDRR